MAQEIARGTVGFKISCDSGGFDMTGATGLLMEVSGDATVNLAATLDVGAKSAYYLTTAGDFTSNVGKYLIRLSGVKSGMTFRSNPADTLTVA